MKIIIENDTVTVHHGIHGRHRETKFEKRSTTVAERGDLPGNRPPALNRYEWVAIEKLMSIIGNAVNREDTPISTFHDLMSGNEKLGPRPQMLLSRSSVGKVELRLVREIDEADFRVGETNGTVEITNPDLLADLGRATYVETDYSWKPPPSMQPWDRPPV